MSAVVASRRVGESLAGALSGGFAREVLARVAELELVAAGVPSSPQVVARVREQLRVLLAKWSRLLAAHTADEGGHCRRCRTWCGRRRRWPCRVWLVAHAHLVRHQIPAQAVTQTALDPDSSPISRLPGWPGVIILDRSPDVGERPAAEGNLAVLGEAWGMTRADLSGGERGLLVSVAGKERARVRRMARLIGRFQVSGDSDG